MASPVAYLRCATCWLLAFCGFRAAIGAASASPWVLPCRVPRHHFQFCGLPDPATIPDCIVSSLLAAVRAPGVVVGSPPKPCFASHSPSPAHPFCARLPLLLLHALCLFYLLAVFSLRRALSGGHVASWHLLPFVLPCSRGVVILLPVLSCLPTSPSHDAAWRSRACGARRSPLVFDVFFPAVACGGGCVRWWLVHFSTRTVCGGASAQNTSPFVLSYPVCALGWCVCVCFVFLPAAAPRWGASPPALPSPPPMVHPGGRVAAVSPPVIPHCCWPRCGPRTSRPP